MPTRMVDRADAKGWDTNRAYMPDEAPELYAAEHASIGPRGSLLAYRNDTFHRAVDMERPNGARFLLNVSYKRADVEWIGYHLPQSNAGGPAWTQFVEESTPANSSCSVSRRPATRCGPTRCSISRRSVTRTRSALSAARTPACAPSPSQDHRPAVVMARSREQTIPGSPPCTGTAFPCAACGPAVRRNRDHVGPVVHGRSFQKPFAAVSVDHCHATTSAARSDDQATGALVLVGAVLCEVVAMIRNVCWPCLFSVSSVTGLTCLAARAALRSRVRRGLRADRSGHGVDAESSAGRWWARRTVGFGRRLVGVVAVRPERRIGVDGDRRSLGRHRARPRCRPDATFADTAYDRGPRSHAGVVQAGPVGRRLVGVAPGLAGRRLREVVVPAPVTVRRISSLR